MKRVYRRLHEHLLVVTRTKPKSCTIYPPCPLCMSPLGWHVTSREGACLFQYGEPQGPAHAQRFLDFAVPDFLIASGAVKIVLCTLAVHLKDVVHDFCAAGLAYQYGTALEEV